MTRDQLENAMVRAGLTRQQVGELLPAVDDYALSQATSAIYAGPGPWRVPLGDLHWQVHVAQVRARVRRPRRVHHHPRRRRLRELQEHPRMEGHPMRNYQPETKVVAGGAAGGLVSLVLGLAAYYHWFTPPPAYLISLMTAIAYAGIGYLVKHTPRPDPEPPPMIQLPPTTASTALRAELEAALAKAKQGMTTTGAAS